MKKNWYYCLALTPDSKQKLTEFINANPYTKVLFELGNEVLDHMTLLHSVQAEENRALHMSLNELYDRLSKSKALTMKFGIEIDAIGISDKTMAFRVSFSPIASANKIEHITICTFGDGKPVESNSITKWIPFVGTITVEGCLRLVKTLSK